MTSKIAPRSAQQIAASATYGEIGQFAVEKRAPVRSSAWLDAVRSIDRCVLCGCVCQVQAAHRNEGKGKSQKVDDCLTAALCPTCHSEIDQGRDLTREERRARMNQAIVETLRVLVRQNLVGAR
ncbi:hypothetical protein [Chitinolyticbacter meiyuanensis]|uniref:hypothetical protein n=1 Tax=Chitinolyticbacter meiyuanensis TaxID=682798 RepID=UPI001FEAC282|nr:hypothetical protein [Chitinolyticbacter meiyuanensis]